MEKYLVTIEFRYKEISRVDGEPGITSRTLTIGVFDDFGVACEKGNNLLVNLENRFPLHVYPGNCVAEKSRFSQNGGVFGSRLTLVTNLAYLKTPFQFYAKISTLRFGDVNETTDDVLEAIKTCQRYENLMDET